MVKFGELAQLVNPDVIFIVYYGNDRETYLMKYAEEIKDTYLEDCIVVSLDDSPYGFEVYIREQYNI